MQKKIIALAVAGLMSGAAFAQSNVSIYGIVDAGYRHDSSHVRSDVGARNVMAAGGLSSSRIGFRGTEDLGNGLKANFTLEYSLANDENRAIGEPASGFTKARTQTLGLSGNFGTLQMGRQLTPQNIILTTVDPFAGTGVGGLTNVYVNQARLDNVFAYVSPSFSGLNIIAAYTWNGVGSEGNDNKSANGDAKVGALAATYTQGPIYAGFNYHSIDMSSTTAATDALGLKVWDIAGSYDFGMVKLSAAYGQIKPNSDLKTSTGISKPKNFMLGVTVPVSANGRVLASYVDTKWDLVSGNSLKANQWAIGYTHNLSKRTTLYVKYANVDYNDNAETLVRGAGWAYTGLSLGNDQTSFGAYTSQLGMGVRHSF